MTWRPTRLGVIFAILATGCPVSDSSYEIDGEIQVAPSALGKVTLPAVLCAGKGGPLETSGVYGHPASDGASKNATLFCSIPKDEEIFRLHEMITQSSLPKRAYVYAWLQPVPAAAPLCAAQGTATAKVTWKDLDPLMSPTARLPPEQRAPIDWPCGADPQKGMPLASAITFDPEHKTWERVAGGYTEHRTLRIQ
jgi:hypothetical protein